MRAGSTARALKGHETMAYQFVAATEDITIVVGDHVTFEDQFGRSMSGEVIKVKPGSVLVLDDTYEERWEIDRELIDSVEREVVKTSPAITYTQSTGGIWPRERYRVEVDGTYVGFVEKEVTGWMYFRKDSGMGFKYETREVATAAMLDAMKGVYR